MAMVHTLFDEDLVDLGPARHWTKDVDLVRLASHPYSPEAVSPHTGMERTAIRVLARRLANTQRAALYGRIGTSTQAHGGVATWLIYVLNILTGKLDTTGGMMFTQPAIDMIELGAMGGQRGHFGRRKSRVKGLPEFGGEFPSSTMADEILTPGEGQIRAFVTVAGNPVLSSPNGTRLEKAFEQLDFMVSVDYYLNETTRHADVILPPTHALQRSHYDLIFNMMAVRNTAKYSEALFPAPAGVRHDWQILLELAHRLERRKNGGRLGIRQELGWKAIKKAGPDRFLDLALRSGPYGQSLGSLRPVLQPAADLIQSIFPKNHPLHGLSRLSPVNRRWQDLPKGLSLASLRDYPHGVDLGSLRPCMPERLFTRDSKINLAPRRYLDDLGRLHARLTQPVSDDLLLIGRRHVRSNNSWMHNSQRLVKGKERCTMMIHPDDATRSGLTDGAEASVKTEAGEILLPAEITEDIMPGVVSIPHGWGHTRQGTAQKVAEAHAGASINDVIRDDQIDPLSGVSVLNGQSVQVSAWTEADSRKQA
jgi:anaerobic selenocysteine-containing dehydrogenase